MDGKMGNLWDGVNCFFNGVESAIGHDMTVYLSGVLSVGMFYCAIRLNAATWRNLKAIGRPEHQKQVK